MKGQSYSQRVLEDRWDCSLLGVGPWEVRTISGNPAAESWTA